MNQGISEFFASLQHQHKDAMMDIYSQICAANPALDSNIKWNAPNFSKNGVDCVTFRLFPKDCLQIILHRGAKPQNADGFDFADPQKLARWAAKDRGILDFLKNPQLNAAKISLIEKWVEAIDS